MTVYTDRAEWPLVRIRPAPDELASMDGYVQVLVDLAARRDPYVVLLDLRGLRPPDAVVRRRLVDLLQEHRHAYAGYLCAQAVIAETIPERGFVTAVRWMVPEGGPCMFELFDSDADARRWLLSQVRLAS